MSLPRSVLAAAAALGLVMTAGCGSGDGSPATAPTAIDGLAGVHWDQYVRSCSIDEGGSGLGTVIDDVVKGDVTADGRVDTLVVDRCNASTSSWPQVIEVFDGASNPARPRRLATLLKGDPDYPRDVRVTVEPGGRVVVAGRGLSPAAALCCPDIEIRRVFTWSDGSFSLTESSTAPAAQPT